MTRRFTRILAAFALLVGLTIPMGMWGQTTVTWPGTSALPGEATAVANDQNVTIMVSSTNSYANPIRIYSGTTVTINALNDAKILSVAYEASSTGTYVTVAQQATVFPQATPTVSGKFVTWSYSANANVTTFTFTPAAQTRSNGISITYTGGGTPVLYTVTLNDTGDELTETSTGSGVTLPSRDDVPPYTFVGWSTTNIQTETTTEPTIIPVGLYHPTSNVSLYPVYTRTEGSGSTTTEWHLIDLSDVDAGTYALLTTDGHAFNGNISSGHGQATTEAFSFTNDIATTAPNGVCEITFESVSGGFKMHNESKGYLYASAASSGKLGWHASEDSYWSYASDNWTYTSNNAYLRSYQNSSFRTYGQNNGDVLKLAKKVTVSGGTTYYVSVVATITDLTCSGTPTTTSYYDGDSFDPAGLTVTAIFDDNSTSDVTSLVTWTPDPLTVGTTTVTGSYMSMSVTVNGINVSAIPDYVELPFVWAGGSSSDFLELHGVTAYNLGSDYASGNAPYLIKLDGTGDYIQVKTDSKPGTVTIDVKMIGGSSTSNITIQGSADGETFTDVEVLTISGDQNDELTLETTNAFADNVRYVRMLFTKGSNVGVGPITIYKGSLDINGHGGNAGNWYLIASPLTQDMAPTAINGLVASDGHYDLYRFNQNPTVSNENDYLEWENYKIHSDDFVLENGKGYLYASQENTTIYFDGACNNDDTKTVGLDYSTNNPDEYMRGWNLVGNPFTTIAYADHSYLVMGENGTNIIATPVSSSTAINPFTGVFVQATATNQSVTFSKTAPGKTNNKGVINLALSQQVNRGSAMVDKAVVSFNEGDQLGKFVFMESNAKLYIPKNGKDYAIAVAEGKGEMPVNFKAQENGTYTLNIDTENVEMNYLHLIDNMTGMDVDLLQTPSYTFNATTCDYESRFRLVFAANNEDGVSTGSTAFAFYSNGNWIINNAGEATLQVIDLTGRILSSETVNGSVSTTINAVPGVYMLRLINGENVNVQKIVVR